MISVEFLLTSLVVVLIPGTGVLYTIATGLFMGKKASFFAALGCTFGIVPSLSTVAFKGFLINILNPKLTIFFLAFLPQFIPAQAQNSTVNMLILGLIFMAMTFFVFVIYGLLATTVRNYVIHSEKISTIIQRIFAGSFAALGLKLAFTNNE